MIIKNIKTLLFAVLMVGMLSAPFIWIAQGPGVTREEVAAQSEEMLRAVEPILDAEAEAINGNTPEKKECKDWCCGIKLNTNFPGIWTCISFGKNGNTNPTNVFQKTIWTFTKLIMSIILVACFVMIIIAWIMRAWAWEDSSQKTKAKKLIERVAITILLIWFSWVILRIINPNFFG